MQDMRFAELLCTRLCHDLTGPIGALANGAEFLSEEGFEMQGQAVELISTSASQAVARLQFYRRAYGRINDSGEASLSELKKLIEDFLQGSKVTLDWPDTHTDATGISVSYKMSRLIINLVLIGCTTLLRGGSIAIRLTLNENLKEISILASGSSVKWDKTIEEVLSKRQDVQALTPKTIQAELTRELAEDIKAGLSWRASDTSLEFTIQQAMKPADQAM